MLKITSEYTFNKDIDDILILKINKDGCKITLYFDVDRLPNIKDDIKRVLMRNSNCDLSYNIIECYNGECLIKSRKDSVVITIAADSNGNFSNVSRLKLVGDDIETFYKAVEENLLVI